MWNSSIAHFPWCDFSNTFWIFKNFTLLSFLLRVSTNPNTSHCLSYPSPYSLLSPLNSPSPLAYLSNLSTTLHPFHLSLFHLFPSMQPCVCSLLNLPVPTSTLSCPLPLFLAKLSTLTTLSPFPFPSIHSTLLPIQLSLSYFQVLFTSSQPPFLSYLPSCPPHLISYIHFPLPTCLSFLYWLFPIYHDPPCLLPQPFVASLIPNLLSFSSHFTTSLSFHFHHLLHSLPTLHTSKNIWPSSLLPVSIPLSLYPYVLSLSPTVCIYMQELTISFFRSCSLEKEIHFLIHVHALCVPLTQYDLISKIVVKCIYNLGQLKRFVNWSCA